jgi:hypothetical protein
VTWCFRYWIWTVCEREDADKAYENEIITAWLLGPVLDSKVVCLLSVMLVVCLCTTDDLTVDISLCLKDRTAFLVFLMVIKEHHAPPLLLCHPHPIDVIDMFI